MPLTAGPSSSPVMRKLIEPANGRPGDEAQGGGDSSGDAALHVAGAAAPELAVGDLGGERIEPPSLNIAGRDDVGVAGEHEIGPPAPEPRVEVQDRRRPRRLERDELGRESGPRQEIARDKAAPRRPPASPSDSGSARAQSRAPRAAAWLALAYARTSLPFLPRPAGRRWPEGPDEGPSRTASTLGRISRTGAAQSRPTS